MQNVWRLPDDPSRCDYEAAPAADYDGHINDSDDSNASDENQEVTSFNAGDDGHSTGTDDTDDSAAADDSAAVDDSAAADDYAPADDYAAADDSTGADDHESDYQVPLITTPLTPTPLHELSRREPFNNARALTQRSAYCIGDVDVDVSGARNVVAIQDKWDEMLVTCKERFSDVFWKFFLKLHTFSQVVVNTALSSVKQMPFFPPEIHTQFPPSRRSMMSRLPCIHEFWRIVRHTSRIDLSTFQLPSGTRYLDFEFIDPIWGWLLAARRHHPGDLHWKPFAQHRRNEPVYGGGIQYGECFKHAFMARHAGSYLMMMSLHWDGTYGRSLDVTPIAVGVANINNCDKSKETCIGYMPFTPDQKRPEFKKTEKSTRSCCYWCPFTPRG